MAKFKFYALWLCLACIFAFILQVSILGFTQFFLLTPDALQGEIWRFLTSIFLHGSTLHLLYNIFALALFGSILEKVIGSRKFLVVFFTTGIFASIFSVSFYPASLGASGAIYGILGCLTVLRPTMFVWAFGLPLPMFIAAILWVAGGVLGLFMPSNIGHVAHLSGIVIGFLLGIFFLAKEKRIKKAGFSYRIHIPDHVIENWEDKYMK